jgi:hypothetical protein
VGLTTLHCKKIVEKAPRNSAIFNGRRLRRRPRPKLGCGAKEKKCFWLLFKIYGVEIYLY